MIDSKFKDVDAFFVSFLKCLDLELDKCDYDFLHSDNLHAAHTEHTYLITERSWFPGKFKSLNINMYHDIDLKIEEELLVEDQIEITTKFPSVVEFLKSYLGNIEMMMAIEFEEITIIAVNVENKRQVRVCLSYCGDSGEEDSDEDSDENE